MCQKVRGYLGVVREYSREVTMLAGFVVAAVVYFDNREFQKQSLEHIERMTKAVERLDIRIEKLENR